MERPERLLPLSPVTFYILLALADRERHGYAIMQEVARNGGDQVRLGPGTLYTSLKRLLESGLIAESGDRPDPALDDERRRYYRLTDWGRQVAAAEARRLSDLLRVAQTKQLLDGLNEKQP